MLHRWVLKCWLIPTYGHADPSQKKKKKDHFKKVVMNGAECSE